MYSKISCIINPASGTDEPILGSLNAAIQELPADWNVRLTQKPDDILVFIGEELQAGCDLMVVYGGDGTIMQAARVLCHTEVPLLILPGGTANVISKELALPQKTAEVLTLLKEDKLVLKKVDIGMCNDIPFLIRVNYGILATMVQNADTNKKQAIGSLAYGWSAAGELPKATPISYNLTIDGKKIREQGIGLMVANSGNVGATGLTIHPDISVNDGKLDIIIIRDKDIATLLSLATTTLFKTAPSAGFVHYQGTQLEIATDEIQTIICDDEEVLTNRTVFTVHPKAMKVLVPKESL